MILLPAVIDLGRIHTVLLYVPDVSASREFYEGVLGLEPAYASEAFVKYQTGEASLALHSGGSSGDTEDCKICFVTTDVAGLQQELSSQGVEVAGELHETPNGPILEFRSPDGHSLQAIQLKGGE